VSAAKLSKTQQDLLDAMKRGVTVHYMPYAGRFNPTAYYFRTDTMKRCTAAADALIQKGLAKVEGGFSKEKLALVGGAT
jgi:hypothetical protein